MELLDIRNYLRNCSNINQGKKLHLLILKAGLLHSSLSVDNPLIQMYTRCGQLSDTVKLFDEMPHRDSYSWNSLLEAYLKSGTNKEDSLRLFYSMPEKNEYSWKFTISSFAKPGNLHTARELFDKMPVTDEKPWNSMINGYARIGRNDEAMNLFKSLNYSNDTVWKNNTHILATVFKICAALTALDFGKQIHARMFINNLGFDEVLMSSLVNMYAKCGDVDSANHLLNSLQTQPDDFTLSALITGYTKCGRLMDARKVLDHSGGGKCNAVLWNSIIAGYVANNEGVEAINLFSRMRNDGIREDPTTLASVLSATTSLGIAIIGKQIHGHGFKVGFIHDMITATVLIDMYSKCGSLDDACKFFEELQKYDYDTLLLNTMINLYSKCGRIKDARETFDMMPSRSLISWNSMIAGYNQNCCVIEALNLFCYMHRLGLPMDQVSIACVISSCASTCSLSLGEQIFSRATVIGLESDQFICTALIDFYCKCGYIEDGRRLFNEMKTTDEIPWNSMLMGYAANGYVIEALKLFEEMRNEGVAPNNITFVGVLSACDHCGLVEEGKKWFHLMKQEYNIEPGIEHFSCMIDMFARAGFLAEAMNLFDQTSFKADSSMLFSILKGCRAYGNESLGMKVTERICELEPRESSAYVQLSSIHATCGNWERSAQIRGLMEERGVRKIPGYSWIDD
ncbi:putative pentatricopeptide repeat-containing protein At1g77010, mitochondrial [Papaver somniferum]|uniref:putative pentatricopeptide repeat-containing protein At1g77010, mitochondrial n=1 Tax=Papaver somniferum TaxID=3469 RepID=UPI000E701B2A|nr:putative pentatricopeptide repeat-containing protein At1g77010, mitochondrial [Papaver somniferum]XP_026455278.1 putative pentatricopeptide repeat-containing protein At1g77010, mitochondrial [Papaver somniferum]